MSLQLRDVASRRTMTTALPLYHSSQLKIKQKNDMIFKKHHAELRGTKIFLYPNETELTYTEMLNLEGLKSMDLHWSQQKKSTPVYILKLSTETLHLKMASFDTGEEWKSFILTVAKKHIPSNMKRLPGQILQLQDVLVKEKSRCFISLNPPLPPRPPNFIRPSSTLSLGEDSDLPSCFLDVSRQEAEELLESNPEYGSIIIRPSSLVNCYAVTIRQQTSSGAACKNYKVTKTSFGFVIELETSVTVPSLNSVLKYFIEVTECRLSPFMSSFYNTRIGVETNLTTHIAFQPQTAQAQWEHGTKPTFSSSLSSGSSSVISSTGDMYENGSPPQASFVRNPSDSSFSELNVELQEALKSRKDNTENTEWDYEFET